MSHQEATSQDHAEEKHATIKTYTVIAVILGLITALEIALPEFAQPYKESMGDAYPRTLWLIALYGLSIIKFWLVIAFFMHLKYDKPFYTHAFMASAVIAVGTFVALLALSPAEPPNQRFVRLKAEGKLPVAAPVVEEEVIGPADPEAGAAVFISAGCMACHVISSLPGAVGTTGPKLDGLGQIAASRIAGMDAETYIRQSIEDPNAYVVEGYMKIMPSMRAAMSGQDFVNLVAYLKGL